MLDASTFRRRRARLATRVPGPILLIGNGERSRNLPMTRLPFRQDSTFLYFTGCDVPGAAALLVDGRCELFLPDAHVDDPLWHGTRAPTTADGLGVDALSSAPELEDRAAPLRPRTLAVADDALVDAVIALRRTKETDEIAEIREAARITALAFRAVVRATHPGSHERSLWTLFEAVLRMGGCTTGYDTILTQSGEILHNYAHTAPLEAGRLLLLDGGGEVASGYGVDITRTWPVSGRFDPRQAAAYDAVLEAQRAAIAMCTVGTRYRSIHDAGARVLARFLCDEGLVRGSPDDAVEAGAHALFFPHGIGHLLGLDVHDLENFGDRPSYAPGEQRPAPFGTRNLRRDLPLEAGWVVTIEPGLYAVPAILNDAALREQFRGRVDFDRAAQWIGFGGIRIEDDVLVAPSGPDVLTHAVPKQRSELEAALGSGPTAEALLWSP